MTHQHTDPGSHPEDQFDHWLDALVAGTPADAASHNGTDGSLGRAMSGARQLHGLAAGTVPAGAAQRRIEEDLMRSGALAAPRGTTWIPNEKEKRRAPWWSPTSPVIAAALVVAMIVALSASFIATQRPAEAPTPDPGFAMASPSATAEPATGWKDLFIITDGSDLAATNDGPFAVATLNESGLTLPVGDGTITIPDVVTLGYTGEPGTALIYRRDGTVAVIDLTTGEALFEVASSDGEIQNAPPFLMTPTSDALTDWEIVDLRTGDSRLLSDIVDIPADTAVMPALASLDDVVGDARIIEVAEGHVDDSRFVAREMEAATLVVPGSLDRAVSIPDYPSTRERAGIVTSVLSDDGNTFAYETRAGEERIVILDTATGEERARLTAEEIGDDPTLAGFAADGRLIASTGDRLVAIDLTADEPITTITDGFERLASPIVYGPDGLVYAKQVDTLLRIDLTSGDVTEVATELVPGRVGFTKPGSPWITFLSQDGQTLLDARAGEIVSQMKPPISTQVALYGAGYSGGGETGGDGSLLIFATELLPEAESAWLLSPELPDGLELTVPVDTNGFVFSVSQDGQHIFAKGDGYSEAGSLWMTPLSADPKWRQLADSVDIEALFAIPADVPDARTLPAQEFATPAASQQETKHVTSFAITAKDDIYLTITVDGVLVFEGDLPAGRSTDSFTGSELEVSTTSGENTVFTSRCNTQPFNMGHEPGEAYYILVADAASCSPEASPIASSVVASAADAVMVVEGSADEARVENGVRIATLGDDGLTLPVGGEIITVPDAVQVRTIWGHSDTLHVIRADGTETVVDLATGDILFEIPEFQNWARGSGRWQFVPTDEMLTDWTVIDMTTGETRLLSDMIDLPGDSAVMPVSAMAQSSDGTEVFRLELGTPETTGWVTTDPAARTFVIAGSLDRVTPLPDYPTLRDNVGNPTLVASADGDTIAYETRAGDSRIVVLDVTSGEEVGRFGIDAVGENPTLAGFTGNSTGDLVITTDDGRVLQLFPGGEQALVLHDGLEGIDNPLLFRDGSLLYVRQVDTLLRIELLPDGAVREVAAGLVPGVFGFTTPHGNMIVAQTRDGHIMVDARTGEVVSRMKAPANRSRLADDQFGPPVFDVANEGEVVIFAIATTLMPLGPNETPSAVWLLSPDFPDGLEIAAPEDAALGNAWLSPDGETLYAYTSERMSGPGTIWQTPLGEETNWQVVIEDVTPLPNPMMFFSTE